MFTIFDSISFNSVARKPVCVVLDLAPSRPSTRHSNAKMLHEIGYRLQ